MLDVLLTLLILGLSAACATAPSSAEPPAAAGAANAPEVEPFKPPPPVPKKFDWVRLTSGEWLKGDITVMRDDSLEFDSDKLDDLTLDWEDVAEIRSVRTNSVLIDDGDIGTPYTGTLHIVDGAVVVGSGEEERRFERKELLAIVPGEMSERNFWSGRVSVGVSGRSGNVNQLDVGTDAELRRRTVASEFSTVYHGTYGKVDGDKTADNQRVTTRYDLFLGSDWFLTPAFVEYYRDALKNIDYEITPGVQIGYHVVDRKDLEWNVTGGGGYRYTRFDSVEEDDDDTDTTAALTVGTALDWDVTKDIEFHVDYSLHMGVPETGNTNHHAFLSLSIDLAKDLDLDLSLIWDRVGQPARESDGDLPERNDYRYSVGLGWEF
jgi:putative salt-induced outer membrane protein YdiY